MSAVTPSGYTSGQITIPATTALELGPLIQTQIDANAAMGGYMVSLQADTANTAAVLFGQDGTVSAAKYGFSLAAGLSRLLGGGSRETVIPVGRMYVYATASSVLHIEIFP